MSHPKPDTQAIKPVQPGASPISGVVPPVHSRFKPDQSGNPKGRPNAGAMVRDFYNSMADKTLEEVQRIAHAPNVRMAKRRAALDWLRANNPPDMADYTLVLQGRETLTEAHERGVDTTGVKAVSVTPGEHGTAMRLTLHDRGDTALDRILDRTIGKPRQAVEVQQTQAVGVQIRMVTMGEMAKVKEITAPPEEHDPV